MKKAFASITTVLIVQAMLLLFFSCYSYSQNLYFSKSSYSDSEALSKALPMLAQQTSSVYNDRNRILQDSNKENFYDTAFQYEMAAQHYKKSIELLDSSRKYAGDYFGNRGIEFESYANARDENKAGAASFDKLYIAGLKHLYENLSYEKQIAFELNFDTSLISSSKKDFYEILDTLKNKNSDSINFKDAQILITAYNAYQVYSKVVPLAAPYINSKPLRIMYPVIKTKWSGVFPVKNIDEIPDPI